MLSMTVHHYNVNMATVDSSAGEGTEGGPECARDFVTERLREADSSMSPAELAEEYGCSNGHVRNLMSDLRDEGVVRRVGHGQYETVDDEEDGADPDLPEEMVADPVGNAEEETDDEGPEEPAEEAPEETSEPADGEARSEGLDGTGDDLGATEAAGAAAVGGAGLLASTDRETMMYAGAAFIALVVLYLVLVSGESGEQADSETVETDDENQNGGADVPLVEGI